MSSITIKILNMRVFPLEGSVGFIQTTFCSFPTAFLIDRPLPLAQLQLFTNVPALRFRECCVQLSSPHVSTPAYCSGLFCLLSCDLHALLISLPQAACLTCQYLNVGAAGMVFVGNDSALLGCVATGRCCWHRCIVQSTSRNPCIYSCNSKQAQYRRR